MEFPGFSDPPTVVDAASPYNFTSWPYNGLDPSLALLEAQREAESAFDGIYSVSYNDGHALLDDEPPMITPWQKNQRSNLDRTLSLVQHFSVLQWLDEQLELIPTTAPAGSLMEGRGLVRWPSYMQSHGFSAYTTTMTPERHSSARFSSHVSGPHGSHRSHDRWEMSIAIYKGDTLKVRRLIQEGYDLTTHSGDESPLFQAALTGSEPMIRLLLRHGAEFNTAFLELRNNSDARVRKYATYLHEVATKFWKDHEHDETSDVQKTLRRIRNEFRKEHEKIKLYAIQFGLDWASAPESELSRSWFKAIKVVRRLCDRDLPTGLFDTLLILGLANAVARHLDTLRAVASHDSYEHSFCDDLFRWKSLFNSTDADLWRYQAAVWQIWQTDVRWNNVLPAPCDRGHVRIQFQNLARSLVTRLDHVFDGAATSEFPPSGQSTAPADSAHCSRSESSQTASPSDGSGSSQLYARTDSDSTPARKKRKRIDRSENKSRVLLRQLEDAPHVTACRSESDKLHLLLIMGAIFALILHFLLMIKTNAGPDSAKKLTPKLSTQTEILATSISLLLALFNLPEHYCGLCSEKYGVYAYATGLDKHLKEHVEHRGEKWDRKAKRTKVAHG